MARTIRNANLLTVAAQSNILSYEKYSGQNKRLVIEIANTNAAGGDDVWVSVGEEAALTKGRRIQPGQSIIWSTDSGYIPPQQQINAFATGATTIAIYEEIEVL